MKKLFLITLVLSLLFQPSFSQQNMPIWGDLFFDMKRKQAINMLKKHCKNIDYETKVDVGITGKGCSFPFEPFQNTETSIDLVFDYAFFKINKRLRYVGFRFEDYNREHLKRLYQYSKDNWYMSSKWRCNPPLDFIYVNQTVQMCGVSFYDGRVRLINSISLVEGLSTDLKSLGSRTTSMSFHAFAPKSIATGSP